MYGQVIIYRYLFAGRLLQADYLSARGKWIHLGKLLTLVFIPILGGWVFTLYSLTGNILRRGDTVEVSDFYLFESTLVLFSHLRNVENCSFKQEYTCTNQNILMHFPLIHKNISGASVSKWLNHGPRQEH
jgi:hypothetical protein